jgi:class 3 adenylate cyclase
MSISLPTGTVTFLFTDIQGSTPLWEREPEKMAEALQIHNDALRQAIEANRGVVFKTVGDAFQAAFPTALQGLRAAIEGQRALQAAHWNELGPLQVRMGLHTGEAAPDPSVDEYAVAHTKNHIGRIHPAAHGEQDLFSSATGELLHGYRPEAIHLRDLGEVYLKGMSLPEHLFQVVVLDLLDALPLLISISYPQHSLPLKLTSFIVLEKEIDTMY